MRPVFIVVCVAIAKRRLETARCDIRVTQYAGDVADAHKSINSAVTKFSVKGRSEMGSSYRNCDSIGSARL